MSAPDPSIARESALAAAAHAAAAAGMKGVSAFTMAASGASSSSALPISTQSPMMGAATAAGLTSSTGPAGSTDGMPMYSTSTGGAAASGSRGTSSAGDPSALRLSSYNPWTPQVSACCHHIDSSCPCRSMPRYPHTIAHVTLSRTSHSQHSSHCHSVCRRMRSCVSWLQSMGLQTGQSLPRPSQGATESPAGALGSRMEYTASNSFYSHTLPGADLVTISGHRCHGSISSRRPCFQGVAAQLSSWHGQMLFNKLVCSCMAELTHSHCQDQLHVQHAGHIA